MKSAHTTRLYTKRSRVNGFQYPYSIEQLFVLIFYLISSAGYLALILLAIEPIYMRAFALPVAFFMTLAVITWSIVEYTDPAQIKIRLRTEGKIKSWTPHYCSVCNKNVPGLDHHCIWLNTCIGRKTYAPFFILVVSSFLQMFLQLIFGVFLITQTSAAQELQNTLYFSRHRALIYSINIVEIFLSGVLSLALLVLLVFHLYLILIFRGTTYDFQLSRRGDDVEEELERRNRMREQSERRRAEQRENHQFQGAWAKRRDGSNHDSFFHRSLDHSLFHPMHARNSPGGGGVGIVVIAGDANRSSNSNGGGGNVSGRSVRSGRHRSGASRGGHDSSVHEKRSHADANCNTGVSSLRFAPMRSNHLVDEDRHSTRIIAHPKPEGNSIRGMLLGSQSGSARIRAMVGWIAGGGGGSGGGGSGAGSQASSRSHSVVGGGGGGAAQAQLDRSTDSRRRFSVGLISASPAAVAPSPSPRLDHHRLFGPRCSSKEDVSPPMRFVARYEYHEDEDETEMLETEAMASEFETPCASTTAVGKHRNSSVASMGRIDLEAEAVIPPVAGSNVAHATTVTGTGGFTARCDSSKAKGEGLARLSSIASPFVSNGDDVQVYPAPDADTDRGSVTSTSYERVPVIDSYLEPVPMVHVFQLKSSSSKAIIRD